MILKRKLKIRIQTSIDGAQQGSVTRKLFENMGVDKISIQLVFERPSLEDEICLTDIEFFVGDSEEILAHFTAAQDVQLLGRGLIWGYQRPRNNLIQNYKAFQCIEITQNPEIWMPYYKICLNQKEDILDGLKKEESRIKIEDSPMQGQLLSDEYEERGGRRTKDVLKVIQDGISFYSSPLSFEKYYERMRNQQMQTLLGVEGFIPTNSGRVNEGSFAEDYYLRSARMSRLSNITLDIARLAMFAGSQLEQNLTNLFPLGPFRRPPERWYIYSGTKPQDVGFKGELLPDLLFRNPNLVSKANTWLEHLKIGYQLKVRPVGGSVSDLFEVRLFDTRRDTPVDVGLSDVGFGISQILPFIVQSLGSQSKIISIEQPEVHIHPKLQADLGDLLADTIRESLRNQFLIETHSEHLVLRLQKLVREHQLEASDVSIIYVSRQMEGAKVQKLQFDDEGNFVDDWPGGFFPERLREMR